MINIYKPLKQQTYSFNSFSLVPIRFKDRMDIMKWRNEQMYHLRQSTLLTEEKQNFYFHTVVKELFHKDKPNQILFSFLKNDDCIGYGGLVHINWEDRNAEVSFIMETKFEENEFENFWEIYLKLIKEVAFEDLSFHKIYTYAFDLRPRLYVALENSGFFKEAIFKEHCFFDNKFIDVIIHSFINNLFTLKELTSEDLNTTFNWANNSEIRFFSFNKDKISIEHHTKWFFSKLKDKDCYYFIAFSNFQSVGSIRFDIKDKNALISYLIDPDYHGRGFGTKILQEGIKKITKLNKEIDIISGYVKLENKASIHIFKKLNFKVKNENNNLYFFKKIK